MRYKWKDKTAGENMGRASLDLFGKQLDLVKAIEKTGTPVIIVLVNGKPISEPWLQNNIPASMKDEEYSVKLALASKDLIAIIQL